MSHQRVQITAGPYPGPENKVVIDGVNIANRLRGLTFATGGRGDAATLTLEYVCAEGVDIDGVAYVRHDCPLADVEGDSE